MWSADNHQLTNDSTDQHENPGQAITNPISQIPTQEIVQEASKIFKNQMLKKNNLHILILIKTHSCTQTKKKIHSSSRKTAAFIAKVNFAISYDSQGG